ncbi:hypothetical protein Lepto7375DRAFT_7339 [Leptolyngbya sp. PCC 7375]|nr:hypothetical protein Lepto7375DRAFT_7339 [Leptolyngbya sp. PCC 7375]
MTKIWTRYPKTPKSQEIIKALGIGAVSCTAWANFVYPDGDYSNPNFSRIEERLSSLSDGHPTHIHPIIAKGSGALWQQQEPHLEEMCFRVLDKYADKYQRWTIANELLTKRGMRIVNLYEAIAERYPHLELWIGEYGLNSAFVSKGLPDWIYELKAAAPNFQGLVLVDYVDLRPGKQTTQFIKHLGRLVPISKSWLKGRQPDTPHGWLELLEAFISEKIADGAITRLKVAGLELMSKNLATIHKSCQRTDVKMALETSVFVGSEPDAKLIARGALAYKLLLEMCETYGMDLWHWNLFDSDFSAPWLHTKEDSCGWFDKDHQMKDWAEAYLINGASNAQALNHI